MTVTAVVADFRQRRTCHHLTTPAPKPPRKHPQPRKSRTDRLITHARNHSALRAPARSGSEALKNQRRWIKAHLLVLDFEPTERSTCFNTSL
jgi:hypothetical protein